MTIAYNRRPSLGFAWFVLVILLTGLLFAWAWQEPDLDHAWSVLHRLERADSVVLSPAEQAAIERVLARYPELRLALTADGRAVEEEEGEEETGGEGGE